MRDVFNRTNFAIITPTYSALFTCACITYQCASVELSVQDDAHERIPKPHHSELSITTLAAGLGSSIVLVLGNCNGNCNDTCT